MSRVLYQLSYAADEQGADEHPGSPDCTDWMARAPEPAGAGRWLRRPDSNRRPSGYEPDELPLLHAAGAVYQFRRDAPTRCQARTTPTRTTPPSTSVATTWVPSGMGPRVTSTASVSAPT